MSFHSHADHEDNKPQSSGGDARVEHQSFWHSKAAVAMAVFVAITGFFLITEHWAHLYGILPYLFILACPLMHVFMHHGHGGHRHHKERPSGDSRPGAAPDKQVRP